MAPISRLSDGRIIVWNGQHSLCHSIFFKTQQMMMSMLLLLLLAMKRILTVRRDKRSCYRQEKNKSIFRWYVLIILYLLMDTQIIIFAIFETKYIPLQIYLRKYVLETFLVKWMGAISFSYDILLQLFTSKLTHTSILFYFSKSSSACCTKISSHLAVTALGIKFFWKHVSRVLIRIEKYFWPKVIIFLNSLVFRYC